jgi:hypothetical protein
MAPIDSLERCMAQLQKFKANGTGFRAFGTDAMSDRLLGILGHEALQLGLGILVLQKGRPGLAKAGEDAAAYDQLLARICAAVRPVDIIDEVFIADVVSLEWEVLRWRRLKWSFLQALAHEVLGGFLTKQLDYNLYLEDFADSLAEILSSGRTGGFCGDAGARVCAE